MLILKKHFSWFDVSSNNTIISYKTFCPKYLTPFDQWLLLTAEASWTRSQFVLCSSPFKSAKWTDFLFHTEKSTNFSRSSLIRKDDSQCRHWWVFHWSQSCSICLKLCFCFVFYPLEEASVFLWRGARTTSAFFCSLSALYSLCSSM